MRNTWAKVGLRLSFASVAAVFPLSATGYDDRAVSQCYGDSIAVHFGDRSAESTVPANIPLDVAVAINAFGSGETFFDPLTSCVPEPVLIQSAYFTLNHAAALSLGVDGGASWKRMEIVYSGPGDAGPGLSENQATFARALKTDTASIMSNGFLKLYETDSLAGDYVFPPDFTGEVESFVECAPAAFQIECHSQIAMPEGLSVTYWFYADEVAFEDWKPLAERVRTSIKKLLQ